MPLIVNACQIQVSVVSVITSTGKDNPVRIHAPVMIAVSLLTVYLFQFASLSSLQVKQPLITLVMPDGEIAIIHQSKHHVLTIV